MEQNIQSINDNQKDFSNPKIKMDIKKMNIYATWNYNLDNDNCSLCHQHLMVPSKISIREKKVHTNVIVGSCNHGFHECCINRWINSIKNNNNWSSDGIISCPICKTTWKPDKYVNSGVYIYNNTVLE